MSIVLHIPLHSLYILLCCVACCYFFLLSVSNILWLKFSSRRPRITNKGKVSVLIPARNEERTIGPCLDSLLNQTYEDYEIIVLDDNSSDGTWNIIQDYASRHRDRIKAVQGKPLPAEWYGKPYAMHQLARHASGDYFLFTDADTVHGRESLAWAVTNMFWHRVDFISGYVAQETGTLGEALIVPSQYVLTTIILPLWLIAATRFLSLSHAIGQFIMFKAEAYKSIGGYEAVRNQVSEDIHMSRRMKKAGFRIIFLDIKNHVRCRMYDGYSGAVNGISKNICDYFNNKIAYLCAVTAVIVLFILLPLVLLPLYPPSWGGEAFWLVVCICLFFITWASVISDRGFGWQVACLYPIMFMNLVVMAWTAFGKVKYGKGIEWKGRMVR